MFLSTKAMLTCTSLVPLHSHKYFLSHGTPGFLRIVSSRFEWSTNATYLEGASVGASDAYKINMQKIANTWHSLLVDDCRVIVTAWCRCGLIMIPSTPPVTVFFWYLQNHKKSGVTVPGPVREGAPGAGILLGQCEVAETAAVPTGQMDVRLKSPHLLIL